MWYRAGLFWVIFLVAAIINGALRETILRPALGIQPAHVVSTFSLSILIFPGTWLTVPFVRYESLSAAWGVGVLWVTLTLAFEFLAGHFVFGKAWDVLFADYDVMHGRIWPLVLLVTLVAPRLAAAGARESMG